MDSQDFLEQTISSLKQQRDELRLQMHLAHAEAKEEWDKMEGKLSKLSDDYEPLKDAAEESAQNVFESLKLVAEEVANGFHRIRKSLTEE